MTKKERLIWRLKETPTSQNLRELVQDGILSKDEAREILFSSETVEDRDKESLKSEIKFLRELIEKLANTQKVVEIIREIDKPYWRKYPWHDPYVVWCSRENTTTSGSITLTNADNTTTQSTSFSDITTF